MAVEIKTTEVIPDDELWLHRPEAKEALDRALDWSAGNPRAETDLDQVGGMLSR